MSQNSVFEPLPMGWVDAPNLGGPLHHIVNSIIPIRRDTQLYAREHQVLPLLLPGPLSNYARHDENSVSRVRALHYLPLEQQRRMPERYYVGFNSNVEHAAVDLRQLTRLVHQPYPYGLRLNQYRYVTLTMEDGYSWQVSLFVGTRDWLLLGLGERQYILDSEHMRFVVGGSLYGRYDTSDHVVKPVHVRSITVFDERLFSKSEVIGIPIHYLGRSTIHALHSPDRQANMPASNPPQQFAEFLAEREEGVKIQTSYYRSEREQLTPEYQAAERARIAANSERKLRMLEENARVSQAFYDALKHGRLREYYEVRDAAFKGKSQFAWRFGPKRRDHLK